VSQKNVIIILLLSIGFTGVLYWRLNLPVDTPNLLDNTNLIELNGWDIKGTENTTATASPDKSALSLSILSSSGGWVGVGQKLDVDPLQQHTFTIHYDPLPTNETNALVVLQVVQVNKAGAPTKSEEFSSSPIDQGTLSGNFTTGLTTAAIEIGIGVKSLQALSINIHQPDLQVTPQWYTRIIHDPIALPTFILLVINIGITISVIITFLWSKKHILSGGMDGLLTTTPLRISYIVWVSGVFFGLIVVMNRIIRAICTNIISFSCPVNWPMSVFSWRLPDMQNLLIAGLLTLIFLTVLKYLDHILPNIWLIIVIGIIFVLGSNLIQGWTLGFREPMTGGGGQYYYDAIKINSVLDFLQNYEINQPMLENHTRTHPPGAPLTIYALLNLLKRPEFVSLIIGGLSVTVSIYFFQKLAATQFEWHMSNYLSLLFILIPAVQIYFAASIDALISSYLLGFVYFFVQPKIKYSIVGAIIFLFLASFTTFGFVFILPPIIIYELLKRRTIIKSIIILFSLIIIYIIIYQATSFNYLNSFFVAAHIEGIEHTGGFMLISEPASYIATRLEGVFELILFFGPFLMVMLLIGWYRYSSIKADPGLPTLTLLILITVAGLFLAGLYRTGETARISLYIYPYLLFPIAKYLMNVPLSKHGEKFLVSALFSQTILMQLFGHYFW